MSIDKISMIASLIIFSFWIVRLNYKIFEKPLKKCVMGMGGLLIFWLIIRVVKMYADLYIFWYLYYVALIFVPTLYYICSKILSGKQNKINTYIIIAISVFLLILVLTNDMHNIVFKIKENGGYINYIGYFIVLAWILYLIIRATFNLVLRRRKYKKDIKSLIPFVPITLGIIYTIFYVANIPPFIRNSNMTVVLGILFFIGIEGIFVMDLIPNNIKYDKVFRNSYLPVVITSKSGEKIFETNDAISIPKQILQDIKNNEVKENYKNLENKKQVYEIGILKDGYSIMKKDSSNIEKLKEQLEEKNKELKKQEDLLIKQRKLKDKLYEIKVYNEILESLEDRIEEKKDKIQKIMNSMAVPDEKKLEEVKNLIVYCKRMSNLIISNYNNELYNKEKLLIILNELLEDSKTSKISGAINISENLKITSYEATKIYEIIFEIFQRVREVEVLLNIKDGQVEILFDREILNLKCELQKELKDDSYEIGEKNTDDGTKITIKIEM